MQEEPRENTFIPDTIDEQIAQLKQGRASSTVDTRLLRDLEQAYQEEQAIERIYTRLSMRVAKMPLSGERDVQLDTRVSEFSPRRERKQMKRSWKQQWGVFVAALIAILAVGSLVMVLQIAQTSKQHAASRVAGQSGQQVAPTSGMYLGLDNQVVRVDLKTHKVLWRFVVKSDPNDLPAFQQIHIHSAPLVAGERAYFTAQNGRLYALNAQTGELLWKRDFQQETDQLYVVNGVLYISTSWSDQNGIVNNVYALDPANGTTKIKYKATGQIAGVFDGTMYLDNFNTLIAIRVTDGRQLWQTQIDPKQYWGNNVYVNQGVLYASSTRASEKTANEPQDSYVYTLDRQSGKITWQSAMMNGFVLNIAAGDDGRIYCGAQNHYVYAFNPKAKTSQPLWTYHTIAGHVYPAPIVHNGMVYVGQSSAGGTSENNNGPSGNKDHLVALDAATGVQKWATPLIGFGGIGDNEPLILHNDVIYLGVLNGVQGFASANGKNVLTLPIKTLFSNKDVGPENFITAIAITIVP